ncbi:hypothetical protein FACS189434_05180 [Bacteroidia bacterium]|nr:hypothetical protein FACS189434_05180 [Bacteroidia bacterium]
METVIIPSKKFKKSFKKLLKKYASLKEDYKTFETELLTNHELGVYLSGGFRKIRLAIQSKGKGKSGGARIITYALLLKEEDNAIVLVDIYDKSEKDTMEESEYTEILKEFIYNEL